LTKGDNAESLDLMPTIRLLDPDCPNLYAVAFTCMKALPAEFIISEAVREGSIQKGTTVIETSSGSFGLGLALACHKRSLELIIIGDPAISPDWKTRLERLGCRVVLVDGPDEAGTYQRPRLALLRSILDTHPNHFCPRQYDNPLNPLSYSLVAGAIVRELKRVDVLVGPVGSGGSSTGTARFVRTVCPQLRLVGVDTFRSVLFGQPDGVRLLRGMGNSIIPLNLQHEAFDEVHWIGAHLAYRATQELWRECGLRQGPTSGAAYVVGRWCSRQRPDARIAMIMPDEGARYGGTIFDDKWKQADIKDSRATRAEPVTVKRPEAASGEWCRYEWGRRTIEAVLGGCTADTEV
jgi:cysteine synthase A